MYNIMYINDTYLLMKRVGMVQNEREILKYMWFIHSQITLQNVLCEPSFSELKLLGVASSPAHCQPWLYLYLIFSVYQLYIKAMRQKKCNAIY